MNMTATLATRIRAAREAINPKLTQQDIAEKVGRSKSAVNLWEQGKSEPSALQLAELSQILGVTTDWLLGVDNSRPTAIQGGPEAITINVVPVISPDDLSVWRMDNPKGLQQTAKAYHKGTAAAMVVTSDALASVAPKGSVVVVSKAEALLDDQVVVAVTSESKAPIVRRYVAGEGDGLLVADDTRFPSHAMGSGVKIIGKVVEVTLTKVIA